MQPKQQISILCTGSEILDGRILDTNSRLIIESLKRLGLDVQRVMSCRDALEDIKDSISYLLQSSNCLIISGGLGPTSDDITRDALAEVAQVPLRRDPSVMENLKALYSARKRKFEESNARQADFPVGSSIVPNPRGTAAGFELHFGEKVIFCLPGIPSELEPMLRDSVLPSITHHFGLQQEQSVHTLRVFGLSEARIGELVEQDGVPKSLSVSYRASFPEIFVRIYGPDTKAVQIFAEKARLALGVEYVVSDSEIGHFAEVVQSLLIENNKTVALAESCTGGMLASFLTHASGASQCFLGGVVSYSNSAKETLLGVPSKILEKHGAVSKETACAMASGARDKFAANLAISITGIAGPSGGSPEKPVGTFIIGVCDSNGLCDAFRCFIGLTREMNRQFAAFTALDVIRRYLLKLPLVHTRALQRQD
ncbi:MAG: CinA family nicotinamide mononucleotide deamidase-related protein [Oligoflexia bacterium]|nr:CinA family nicotinamide mononucleotide deamidase-related protein [Oligoflexia bacterium]